MADTPPSPAAPAAPAAALLPSYRPLLGRYDELADAKGHPREHWEQLVRLFERLGPAEIDERRRMADRLLVGEGASYTNAESDEASQAWRIDPVPLLWPRADWTALEAGLAQRARLLDAVIADLYGPQRLLSEGIVPAELVYASSRFRWPCVVPAGTGPTRGPRLTTYAADLVRDGQGRLVVLRDHTDSPGGPGFALVNRRVLSRLFADTYRDARIERLTGYFTQLRTTLAGLAPADRRNPRTVVLTPGVGHPGYFEHTYLASYLGYHLVEGADLAVRGGRVWLRALAGLEPVDVVLRRIDDADTDPLELRGTSASHGGSGNGRGGVPGLLEAAREGGVGVANAIGSGIASEVALQAYLPAASELLLGEALRLPSLPTLWLGDAEQRRQALDQFDELVLHDTTGGGVRSVFAGRLGEREREEWLAAIAAQPGRFVAQPKVVLGTAPVLRDQSVVPGVVVVRALLVADGQGWMALPGGVGRVVDDETPVLTQRGGTAKDIWVPAEERRDAERGWSAVAPAVPQIDLRSSMPSRVAEAMFWVGRNAERAEATARIALALLTRADQAPELAELAGGAWVARTTAGLRSVSGGVEAVVLDASVEPFAAVRLEVAGALGDRPGALADSLGHLAESAGSVREYLSTGTWRVVAHLDARRLGLAADAAKADLIVVAETLNEVVLSLMALAGLAAESIVRGPGWRFLDLGRRLERALRLLGLVEAMLVPATDPVVVQPVYETLLTACESLFAYRRRYRSDLELDPLCELLLADDTNPRSLAFQLDRLSEDVASLPERRDNRQTRSRIDDASRLVMQAGWRDVQRATAASPHLGLEQFVLDTRGGLLALSDGLIGTWFAHVGEAHIVRRADP